MQLACWLRAGMMMGNLVLEWMNQNDEFRISLGSAVSNSNSPSKKGYRLFSVAYFWYLWAVDLVTFGPVIGPSPLLNALRFSLFLPFNLFQHSIKLPSLLFVAHCHQEMLYFDLLGASDLLALKPFLGISPLPNVLLFSSTLSKEWKALLK